MGAHCCPSSPCPYCGDLWRLRWGRVQIEHWQVAWPWTPPSEPASEGDGRYEGITL